MRNNEIPCYRYDERLSKLDKDDELNSLIYSELEKNIKVLDCYYSHIEESKSFGELTYNLQKFFDFSSLMHDSMIKKIMKHHKWRPYGKDTINFLVSEKVRRFLLPRIDMALKKAKSIGESLDADSIGVTIGFPFVISMTINLKIHKSK